MTKTRRTERAIRDWLNPDSGIRLSTTDERDRGPCLVLIGGRSGCGKTSLVNALVLAHPQVYARVPSFTSRARRPGEGDTEYKFVTRDEMRGMHKRGELFSLDEAYGEYYGMSRREIENILAGGRFAAKEMHAKNHAVVRSTMPGTISVLLQLADERWENERGDFDPIRARRLAQDRQYYASLDLEQFEIVHRIAIGETPNVTAEILHVRLQMFRASHQQVCVTQDS